jgi:vitamin B12 transporter
MPGDRRFEARSRSFSVLLLAGLALTAAQSIAQPQERDAGIDDILVTASRVPIEPARVGSAFTVLDGELLRAQQQRLVSDALRTVPGLAVSRGGGIGAITQVRMRGAEGNHTLVLIDGIEANNPVSNSEFDFAHLLVADIDRIEILRGAQSALYGGSAIGGVINVITRERQPGLGAAFHIEAGNPGTHELGLSLGGGGERLSGGISLTDFSTDGENISRFDGEPDGYRNRSVSLNGRAALSERATLRAYLHHFDTKQEYDTLDFSFPPGPTQGLVVDANLASAMTQWFGRVVADVAGPRLQQRASLARTETDSRFFDGGTFTGGNDSARTHLDYQLTIGFGGAAANAAPSRAPAQSLTVALERELTDYANRGATADAPENQREDDRQSSLATEYRLGLARADFSASARFDRNTLFQDASTWRLTGSYRLSEHSRLHTSLGTGINNPGFFELFGFFPGSFVGNPALRPEHSRSVDLGIEQQFAAVDAVFDITYFHADLTEAIETVFDSTTFIATTANLGGKSRRRGIELSFEAAPATVWKLGASYTFTDAEQPDGRRALRRARHIASFDNRMNFAGGRASLNVGIVYNGRQDDVEFVFATPQDRVTLPAYTLLRVAGDFRVAPHWRVHGRVENLLDEDYEEWFSYRGRGRTYVLGFSYDRSAGRLLGNE